MKSGIFTLMENWNNNEENAIHSTFELIKYCDAIGLEEAWIGEHHFNNFTTCASIIPLLSYALATTKNIKIGSAAILLPHYHPIKLSEEIATLDILGKRRFLFGFARGAFPIFDIAMGANAKTNREIMLESAEIIHELLYKNQVNYDGKYFEINNISICPHPSNIVPFFVASDHEETLIKSAKAGHNFLGSLTLNKKRAEEIHTLFKTHNKKSYEFTLARAFYVDTDRKSAEEKAQIGIDIFTQRMLKANKENPTFESIIKTSDYEEFRADFFNKDKILENLIVGTPKDCIEQIKNLQKDISFSSLALKLLTPSLEDAKNQLKIYKEEILPFIEC
ncbi:LLM class flavin-dependent oxidoreductase [Helicobacter burdigaliensis]|uniref:LLM class flavin-dependent oxidoreductase n=1 Tax=Helicobacter burdigaliensis TaxID=2315334 RepID=UPI000EF6521F|nr:LLM class flavin-dependent oxidoreductase [Helicobacter burdigaliensis]